MSDLLARWSGARTRVAAERARTAKALRPIPSAQERLAIHYLKVEARDEGSTVQHGELPASEALSALRRAEYRCRQCGRAGELVVTPGHVECRRCLDRDRT